MQAWCAPSRTASNRFESSPSRSSTKNIEPDRSRVAAMLLIGSGAETLSALQPATIVASLPFAPLLLLRCGSVSLGLQDELQLFKNGFAPVEHCPCRAQNAPGRDGEMPSCSLWSSYSRRSIRRRRFRNRLLHRENTVGRWDQKAARWYLHLHRRGTPRLAAAYQTRC